MGIVIFVTWKRSAYPQHRVICYLMGERLGVHGIRYHGWVLKEHGDATVPIWCGMRIASISLKILNPELGTDADRSSGKRFTRQWLTGPMT